jgi:hypothetical protein
LGNVRRAAFLLVLAGGGLALASLDTPKPRHSIPAEILTPGRPFFIGAWVSPPTSTRDPEVWRRFARTGIDVALRPLEDPNDRARNVATLTLLDSLGISLIPRDDAVHPDELRRPRWRERVRDVVAAYRGHRSLFGYFVVDEPRPAVMDSIAAITREFGEVDPAHPAYVNLLPTYENSSAAVQESWRANAIRLIREGRIELWSWSAYSQRPWGEDATFLLTQRNALEVARATGVPAFAILQFSGFLELHPQPKATLDYLAAESIAHGARGIAWFTYWTPDSAGPEGPWSGGAVAYDGTPSARADTLAEVNRRARKLAELFDVGGALRVAHFGGAMPRGVPIPNDRIPGLRSAVGGPMTVASRSARWLLINRDRSAAHVMTLGLADDVGVDAVVDSDTSRGDPARRTVTLRLEPGASAVLSLVPRR